MSESSNSSETGKIEHSSDDWLDLPDPEGFVSQSHSVSLEMIYKLSEQQLRYVTTRPGFHERRQADKVNVPFEL